MNSKALWQMWNLAKVWKTRPSQLTHITDPLRAFYFDRAVYTFGTEVETAMDEAADGAKSKKEAQRKRQMALAKYMKNADGTTASGTFRDPSAAARQ
jgi:hypothetical protein